MVENRLSNFDNSHIYSIIVIFSVSITIVQYLGKWWAIFSVGDGGAFLS